MTGPQETLRLLLERYRTGRDEAPQTVKYLEGLYAKSETDDKHLLLEKLWQETVAEFQEAVQGKTSYFWIFPVSLRLIMKVEDTSLVTERLFKLLFSKDGEVGRMWAAHIGGELCYELHEHPDRFSDITVARVEAHVHSLEFGARTGLDGFQLDPELQRRLNRITQIISERRFQPVAKSLLEARGPTQAESNLQKGQSSDADVALKNDETISDADFSFCRLAIKEARRSVAEDDGRVHPKVGAVVVRDGKILAVAHRGELPGCHAEYIALEEKLKDAPVSGATVYTTLEPCTRRNPPKIACASRLLERKVRRVVIGMLDPNPAICGKGQTALRKGGVEIDVFPPDMMAEVEDLNREFSRTHDLQVRLPVASVRTGNSSLAPGAAAEKTQEGLPLAVRFCQGFGDNARQLLHGLTVDPGGNVIIVGDLWGSIDFGGSRLLSAGDRDVFIAKFDCTGKHIWSKRYGDTSEDVGIGVGHDAAGAIVLLCAFAGTLDLGGEPLVSRGRLDAAVAKLDHTGQHVWSRSFAATDYLAPECIAVTPSGKVVVAGRFHGSLDFGGLKIQSQSKQTDIFLAGFSRDGDYLWVKRFGGPFEQQTRSVAVDNDGNIALTGVFKDSITFDTFTLTEQRPGDYAGFLAKFDKTGSTLWSKRFGEPYVEQGGAVKFDVQNGDIIVAGAIRNNLPPSKTARTSLCFVGRYDATGVVRWSKTFGTHVWPTSLALARDGRILLTGYFQESVDFGVGALESAGGYDIFAAMFGAEGSIEWSKRFGDRRQQFLVKGAHGVNGSIVLAGSFHGTIDFGTGPVVATGYDGMNEGAEDVFLAILGDGSQSASRSASP